MGNSIIHNSMSTCSSHSPAFSSDSSEFYRHNTSHSLPSWRFLIDLFSQKGRDTPLSPSHAGDKGDYYSFFMEKDTLGLVGAVDSTLKALSRCCKAAVEPLVLSAKEISRSGQSAMSIIAEDYFKPFAHGRGCCEIVFPPVAVRLMRTSFSSPRLSVGERKESKCHLDATGRIMQQPPHGQWPVDMVVLPRPSVKEEGKAAVSVPSKRPFYSLRRTISSTKSNCQSLAAGGAL